MSLGILFSLARSSHASWHSISLAGSSHVSWTAAHYAVLSHYTLAASFAFLLQLCTLCFEYVCCSSALFALRSRRTPLSSFSLFFVKMAFVAWLKAVDMTNEGTVKDDALYKEIADIFIANDISCPQDLVGVDALDFKQLIASPGKRAFVKRAVNAAAEEFKKAQAQVCALPLVFHFVSHRWSCLSRRPSSNQGGRPGRWATWRPSRRNLSRCAVGSLCVASLLSCYLTAQVHVDVQAKLALCTLADLPHALRPSGLFVALPVGFPYCFAPILVCR